MGDRQFFMLNDEIIPTTTTTTLRNKITRSNKCHSYYYFSCNIVIGELNQHQEHQQEKIHQNQLILKDQQQLQQQYCLEKEQLKNYLLLLFQGGKKEQVKGKYSLPLHKQQSFQYLIPERKHHHQQQQQGEQFPTSYFNYNNNLSFPSILIIVIQNIVYSIFTTINSCITNSQKTLAFS